VRHHPWHLPLIHQPRNHLKVPTHMSQVENHMRAHQLLSDNLKLMRDVQIHNLFLVLECPFSPGCDSARNCTRGFDAENSGSVGDVSLRVCVIANTFF
jgi:hypothetical protein